MSMSSKSFISVGSCCKPLEGRGLPYLAYIGICGPKGFQLFWSQILYDVCTLVLNWVCFLEEAPFSGHKEGRENRGFWS